MKLGRYALGGLVAAVLVAAGAGLGEKFGNALEASRTEGCALDASLERLPLTTAQRREVRQLEDAEALRMTQLQDLLAQASGDLRTAELIQPFDEQLVGALLWRRAEVEAYLRGAESRLVARIVPLLTEPQREAFVALRSRPDAERGVAAVSAACYPVL